tara:strand:+ start:3597 stop:5096 length:1500 start_codon:yes stop_codon:yes gene_type:complete
LGLPNKNNSPLNSLDKKDLLSIVGILVLALFSRFLLISEPAAILNGDECIQGLMAKHLAEGKSLSLYFYGQAYGFSFLENIFIAASYKLNGFGENSLKMGVFTLWFTGIIFLYLFLRSQSPNKFRGLLVLLILVLALCPSWMSFSTQARAGYVSAFSLTSLSLWWWQSFKFTNLSLLIQALITVLIYESQPLWFLPLIPFQLYYLASLKNWKKGFFYSFMSLLFFAGFALYKTSLNNFWSPEIFRFSQETFSHNLNLLFEKIGQQFSGLYYLGVDREIPGLMKPFIWLYSLVFSASLVYSLIRIIRRKLGFKMDMVYIFSIGLVLLISLFLKSFNTRYLLALMGFSIFPIFQFLSHQNRILARLITWLLVAFVLIAIPIFPEKYYHPEERIHLNENLAIFDSLDNPKAFVMDPLMQWQFIFYSEEKIKCRYHSLNDRYLEYSSAVNSALSNAEPYLLFSRTYRLKKPFEADFQTVDGGYSFILNPERAYLKKNGFEIGD